MSRRQGLAPPHGSLRTSSTRDFACCKDGDEIHVFLWCMEEVSAAGAIGTRPGKLNALYGVAFKQCRKYLVTRRQEKLGCSPLKGTSSSLKAIMSVLFSSSCFCLPRMSCHVRKIARQLENMVMSRGNASRLEQCCLLF